MKMKTKMKKPDTNMKTTKISHKELGLKPDTAETKTMPRKTSVRGGEGRR